METSEYITIKNKSTVLVAVNDFRGCHQLKVTAKDVVKYYGTQVRSMSGCRTLAGFSGDWRYIDYLAQECLDIFKQSCRTTLVREAKKYGMTPKF